MLKALSDEAWKTRVIIPRSSGSSNIYRNNFSGTKHKLQNFKTFWETHLRIACGVASFWAAISTGSPPYHHIL